MQVGRENNTNKKVRESNFTQEKAVENNICES